MGLPRHITRLAVAFGARALPSAVGHAALVYFLIESWKDPFRFGPRAPYDIFAIWVFEFLFLHSFPFMVLLAAREWRGLATLLAAIYGLIAVGVTALMKTWLLLLFFGWHVLTWLTKAWKAREGAQKDIAKYSASEEGVRMWVTYVTAVGIYLFAVVAAGLLPVPELGWGAAPAEVKPDDGGPAFIAAATIYFTGRLIQDLVAMTWGRTVRLVDSERGTK